MRQVSAALRAAIDAGERIIDSTFTVDWDNDGVQDIDNLSRKTESLTLSQSLESSLPQQVQLVPGVAVAELVATIAKGNTARYTVPSIYRSLTTSTNTGGSSPTWTIATPATIREGDVVLVVIFVSIANLGSVMSSWQVLLKSNVTWLPMSVRGDGLTGSTRLEGLLLYRRATASEPPNYTITLPTGSTVVYASAAVNVGEQNLMGITDFSQKGEDSENTPTGILLPQVRVDVPGSTIVSFFGAASYAVSGIGFSPLDPLNDVEQTEFTVSATGSTKPSIRASVTTHTSAAQGLYQKGVTFTGSAGAQAIATIGFSVVLAPKLAGDEAQHASWTFSELNPNSPYAGKTRIRRKTQWVLNFVTSSGGFESVPMFTGYTTAPSASSREVTIRALDNRETMRNTGQGLNIAAAYPVSQDFLSGSAKPTMPGLETTWIISRLFFLAYWRVRFNTSGVFSYESQFPTVTRLGYFPSPLSSQFAGVWATFHGSAHDMLPENQQLLYAYTESAGVRRRVAFEVGPFVAATKNEAVGANTYVSWLHGNWWPWNASIGQIIGRLQCWVRRNQTTSTLKVEIPNNDNPVITWNAWVDVLSTGVVQFRVEKPSVSRTIVGPTIAGDGLWHFLGVHYDSVAGSVTFRVDNTNTVVAMSTWANAVPAFMSQSANLTLTNGMQIADFQSCGGYSTGGLATGIALTEAWANENFTPTAFVDKSENVLDVFPFVDQNDDSFTIATAIANAEFAAFFFDADGYPHFRNSRSDASITGQTVQKTITARGSIQSIAYESGVLQVRNIISVGYTPFASSINEVIFSISGVIGILPNTTQTYTVILQGPLITANFPTYTAFSQPDGTGINLTGNVTVNYITESGDSFIANAVQITIRNISPFLTAYLVDATGQPNFIMTGTFFSPLQGTFAPITYIDSDSIREFGEQTLNVGNQSVWVQREDSAASLALKLLSDLCVSRPAITQLNIKGDPSLEFGDLTLVQDQNGIGVNGRYRITSKDPNFSSGQGLTQTLIVRSAPTIAYWDINFWDDGTVWG